MSAGLRHSYLNNRSHQPLAVLQDTDGNVNEETFKSTKAGTTNRVLVST